MSRLLLTGAVGGDGGDDGDDKEKEEEAERERQEAIKEAEDRRKEKHRKMEEEREKMRQEIRDKVCQKSNVITWMYLQSCIISFIYFRVNFRCSYHFIISMNSLYLFPYLTLHVLHLHVFLSFYVKLFKLVLLNYY